MGIDTSCLKHWSPLELMIGVGLLCPVGVLKAQDNPALRWQYSAQGILSYQKSQTPEGLFNPGRLILDDPLNQLSYEARTDVSMEMQSIRLDLRPRLIGSQSRSSEASQWQNQQPDIQWNHATINWTSSWLDLHYGLENYQWGPGEILSPSHTLTGDSILDHLGFYEAPGYQQLRANGSWGENLSLVLLFRPSFSLLKKPAEDQAVLLKPEWRSSDGRWFLGLTVTGQKFEEPTWGLYGQSELWDASFIYFDASITQDLKAKIPLPAEESWLIAQPESKALQHTALAGARYNFPGGADLRVEYLRQSRGFSRLAWNNYRQAIRSADPSLRLPLILQSWSGTQPFASSDLLYSSLRWPDIYKGHFNLQTRLMHSLSDPSALIGLVLDDHVGDHMQWLLEYYQSLGSKDQDLTRGISQILTFACRYAI